MLDIQQRHGAVLGGFTTDAHPTNIMRCEGQTMIAIEAAVSSRLPSTTTAIEALGIQLRRHRNVRVGTDAVIVELPSIGNVLLSERPGEAVIQAVVDDELGVKRFAVSLLAELTASAPGADFRDTFALAWSRPDHAPAFLR